MSRCKNRVTQLITKGYGYKEIKVRCGSTSVFGDPLLCDECQAEAHRRFPQGYRHVPGDICKHGTYVGDEHGPDYICGRCEDGL